MHTLGFVATCALHHVLQGHSSDSAEDLMYAGSEPWQPTTLDVNRDDYWQSGAVGCLDLANSAFLERLPASAEPPPGWPYTNLDPAPCADEGALKSDSPGSSTTIGFANATAETIMIHFLDSSGQRQLFSTLGPKEGYFQATSSGYYWLAAASGGQCLGIFSAIAGVGRAIVD